MNGILEFRAKLPLEWGSTNQCRVTTGSELHRNLISPKQEKDKIHAPCIPLQSARRILIECELSHQCKSAQKGEKRARSATRQGGNIVE